MATAVFQTQNTVLENDYIRLVLDENTGGILSLTDKRLDRDWLLPGRTEPLFRLMIPDGHRVCEHQDSEAAQVEVDGLTARLTYALEGLSALVSITLAGEELCFEIELENHGTRTVEECRFPRIGGIREYDDALYTAPVIGKSRQFNPFGPRFGGDRRRTESYMHKRVVLYPERLVSAWCDYSADGGGLALEGRSQEFDLLGFYLEKNIDKHEQPFVRTLEMALVHLRRIAPGERWQSPPLILRFHQGDWHVAADKHREWVETWIRKAPVAAKYAEGLGWHYFLMKHQDGLESFTYADIPAMARAAKHVGCSHLMLFGWHAPGHDNRYMYDYKPNPDWGGEEALRAGIEEARAMGVEVIPFFNGTLANSMLPEHQEFGHRWEAKSREGHPLYAGDWSGFSRDTPSVFRSRIHYEICPCEDSQDFLLNSAHNIVEAFGFANLQLDQLGIKVYPCYNEDHHHRHPDRACIDGFTELLDQLRPFVDRVNPEGVLISECANEFTGQWCNGAWTWDFDGTPEPVLYAVPWLLTSTEIDALEYAEANRAFARKILMDVRIAGGDEYVTEYPGFAEHLRALAQLKRKATAYYVYADFRDREGLVGNDPDGVIIRTFLNRAEKKVGIVVANMSDERRTVVVDHEWAPTGSCLLWSSTGLEKEIVDTGKITLDLDKYEVNILGLSLGSAGLMQ